MTLARLVEMANHLGEPLRDYVILGEGNASAQADEDSFWITASGSELRSVKAGDFVRVDHARVLAALDRAVSGDEAIHGLLMDCRVERDAGPRPSVETFMHGLFLALEGVRFVGHTHPTAINALTCSRSFEAMVEGRLFPDEIVLCGRRPLIVPYIDPGLPLAGVIRARLREYERGYGERPRTVLMQNHGLVALGATAREVENITAMAVKAARILLGTAAFGGPHFLAAADVHRIHGRADEHYRQKVIETWQERR